MVRFLRARVFTACFCAVSRPQSRRARSPCRSPFLQALTMFKSIFFASALLTFSAEGRSVCSRSLVTLPSSWNPGTFYNFKCDANPYATRVVYHMENPDGFMLTTRLVDGINDCNNNAVTQQAGKPESSYTQLGLSNLTFFNGPCNQVPCCLKIVCATQNSRNCSSVKLSYTFENDIATATNDDSTTVEVGIDSE